LSIGRDLVGGGAAGTFNLTDSGAIRARRIGRLTIGGSLIAGTDNTSGQFSRNGAVVVEDDLGSVTVKGSLIGNGSSPVLISARGQRTPTATADMAIGRLAVLGRVEFAQVLAGLDGLGIARNADAQIGPVVVGGDWVASAMAAGGVATNGFFGDGDDARIGGAGVKDDLAVSSAIVSLTVGGQVMGTPAAVNGADHFGVVAETVGLVKVGGATLPTTAGLGNDDFFIGATADFKVNEL
jgi:hypothetical protein